MSFQIKAILVGVSNVKPYLPGVEIDLIAYKNYLKSSYGGAWEDSEIITLLNKSKAELKAEVSRHTNADFLLMLVAGHGEFRTSVDDTVLCTTDTEYISMKDLVVRCKRQVMIIDVCRNVIHDQVTSFAEALSMEKRAFDSAVDTSRPQYRRKYIDLLSKTSEGVLQYYSCGKNQSAGDKGDGGVYSQSLLQVARSLHRTCNVNEVHDGVKSLVYKVNPPQLPTENIGRRRDFPPFSIRLTN